MRRLLLFAMLLASGGAAAQRLLPVDRIVAIVNKEVITASELADAIGSAERELRRRGTAPPERPVLERQMLERLILGKAQVQMARDTGIRVDELQLDRAVQRIAEGNKMTLAEFRAALEKDGVPFDAFRQDVREQITLTRLREREVDDKIQVSDSEIDLFLEATKAAPGERTEYNIAHILVRVPEQASPDQVEAARRRIEQALAQALAGGDFAQIARPTQRTRGAAGRRARLAGARPPSRAVHGAGHDEAGDVARRCAARGVPPAQARRSPDWRRRRADPPDAVAAHLIRTGEQFRDRGAAAAGRPARRILAKEADFGEMARVHSDDASSARGGELDWVYPGDTVPDFERAYQELQIGEISEPVRTQFGVHLVQVLERRSADMSLERRRLQARQTLRERKSDDAYNEWLRQLRDTAYVELRLEER
jgi:peptidyl-prolyl cis-trans isomerase SurA